MSNNSYVFLSYSRADRPIALELTEALKAEGVSVWSDFDNLRAGDHWRSVIQEALRDASALIVLLTERSAQSSWVMHEIGAADALAKGIFPVAIGGKRLLPFNLADRHAFVLPEVPAKSDYRDAAQNIARALGARLQQDNPRKAQFEALSDDLLKEAKSVTERLEDIAEQAAIAPDSIFIVHGHDEIALDEVKAFVSSIGVRPIVLRESAGPDQSLLQRFFRVAGEAKFAVVILSADDVGAARVQFDEPSVGERSLQFRARQNVILELGFFYGQLGWDHVFVLLKQPDRVFPNFEMPSDIGGAVYDRMSQTGRWKQELQERMRKAGFRVTPK